MSDRAAIAVAVAVWVGAWRAAGVPLAVGVVATAVALSLRRPLLLVAGSALLASALGARSQQGLVPPAAGVAVAEEVVLLSDPVDVRGALKVDVGLRDRKSVV